MHAKEFADYTSSFYESLLQNEWIEGDLINSNSSITAKVDNIGFTNIAFETLEKFESYMGVIMSGRFGKIVRAEGFLPINNAWGKFDIVGNTYTLESIESMDGSKLILIGFNLDEDSLTILFNDCPKIQGKNKMNLELLSF